MAVAVGTTTMRSTFCVILLPDITTCLLYTSGNRTEGSGAVFTLLLPVNDLSYTPEECTLPEEEQNKAFPIQTEEQYKRTAGSKYQNG